MMGMGFIRLNNILAKPAELPFLTTYDRRLRSFIVWTSIGYAGLVVAAKYFANIQDYDFEYFIFFFVIFPAGVFLSLWWTTDLAPLFARISIVICSLIGGVISVLMYMSLSDSERVLAFLFGLYVMSVAIEAFRQLIIAARIGGTTPIKGEGDT